MLIAQFIDCQSTSSHFLQSRRRTVQYKCKGSVHSVHSARSCLVYCGAVKCTDANFSTKSAVKFQCISSMRKLQYSYKCKGLVQLVYCSAVNIFLVEQKLQRTAQKFQQSAFLGVRGGIAVQSLGVFSTVQSGEVQCSEDLHFTEAHFSRKAAAQCTEVPAKCISGWMKFLHNNNKYNYKCKYKYKALINRKELGQCMFR